MKPVTWPEGVGAIGATLLHQHDDGGVEHAMYAMDVTPEVLEPMLALMNSNPDHPLLTSAAQAGLDAAGERERVAMIAAAVFLRAAGKAASTTAGTVVMFVPDRDPVWDGERLSAHVALWAMSDDAEFRQEGEARAMVSFASIADLAVPDDISMLDGEES